MKTRSVFAGIASIFALALLTQSSACAQDAKLFRSISNGQAGWTKTTDTTLKKALTNLDTSAAIAVQVNQEALTLSSMTLDLPKERSASIFKTGSTRRTNFTEWYGRTADNTGHLVLITENAKTYGSVRIGQRYYAVQATDEPYISIIKEIVSNSIQVDSPEPVTKPPEIRKLDEQERSHSKRSDFSTPAAPRTRALPGAPPALDVMIVVTPAARSAAAASGASIESWSRTWIAELGQVVSNSGLSATAQVRLVDIYSIFSFDESAGTFQPILDSFAARADVRSRRNIVGADVVLLVINGVRSGACGRAYKGPDSTYAYGVIGFDTSSCGPHYVAAHEIGHLVGADHNRSQAVDQSGDAHGWPDLGDDIRYVNTILCGRTIMAYATAAAAQPSCNGTSFVIPKFSNPSDSYEAWRIGVAGISNNVRTVAANLPIVAGFRNSTQGGGSETLPTAAKINQIILTILSQDN